MADIDERPSTPQERLEYLRGEIEAERISMSEIAELQGLVEHIDPSDVVLLQWAGVPEFPEPRPHTVWLVIEDEGGDSEFDQNKTWFSVDHFDDEAGARGFVEGLSHTIESQTGNRPEELDA